MSALEPDLLAEVGVTREGLAALLERRQLGSLETIKTLEGGTVNPLLLINDRLVLRFNRRDPDLPKLRWEALIYQRLQAIPDVPCPEVLALDTARDLVPFDVLILSYVEGMRADTVWSSLDAAAQEQISEELGRICGVVHSLEWPVYGEFVSVADQSLCSLRWTDIVCRKIERAYTRAAALSALPTRLLDGLVTALNDGDAVFGASSPPTLTHADLWLPNVVLRQDGGSWQVAALLDWEWSIVADASWEFANLWSYPDDPYPLPDAFLAGYRSRRALPNDLRVRQRLYRLLYFFEGAVNLAEREGPQSSAAQFYRTAIERLLQAR
jgi:aminoglycoside phosphotransferase (APT) family kinase protein